MDITELLDCLEGYHHVERLSRKWSDIQLYKCTCPTCHKYGVCEHALLVSMICDRNIKIPARYATTLVSLRRKRGRPKAGVRDQGDVLPRRKLHFADKQASESS